LGTRRFGATSARRAGAGVMGRSRDRHRTPGSGRAAELVAELARGGRARRKRGSGWAEPGRRSSLCHKARPSSGDLVGREVGGSRRTSVSRPRCSRARPWPTCARAYGDHAWSPAHAQQRPGWRCARASRTIAPQGPDADPRPGWPRSWDLLFGAWARSFGVRREAGCEVGRLALTLDGLPRPPYLASSPQAQVDGRRPAGGGSADTGGPRRLLG